MQYVYVLNKHSESLMPCSPGKARLLLKQQKAHVIKRTPFTIKLLYGVTVRPVTVRQDLIIAFTASIKDGSLLQ